MITWKIQVIGKVQGVYFRASTREKAEELGLKGWVKNESDGSVRIEVQGESANVDQFFRWIHQGPPRAKVDQVFISKEEKRNRFQNFEILR